MDDVPFKIFRRFNDESVRWAARSTFRLDEPSLGPFTADPLVERIVRAIAVRRCVNIKEVLESFETFARVRRRTRARAVADVCCGHGLTGLLFAAIEREVEEVVLLDRTRPSKADLVVDAVCEAAPWAREKVRWVEAPVERAADHLADHTSVIAVHACGTRTDRAMEAAAKVRGALAVMPCCYAQTDRRAPKALREALGAELATDVQRTYWLEQEGYEVDWSKIPAAISPMNRILVGRVRESA